MIAHPKHILFGPGGRIGRASFVAGVVMLMALTLVETLVLRALDVKSMLRFLFGFFFYIMFFYMVTSVFVQRLHDMNRSAWVYTGWIAVILLILICVMLAFGGLEYFDALMAGGTREDPISEDEVARLNAVYEAEIAKAAPTLNLILTGVIGGFAAILGLVPGTKGANRFGERPN